MSQTIAILVAAGRGARAGRATPKQYRNFLGRPLLRWSADALSGHDKIDRLIVAVGKDYFAVAADMLGDIGNVDIVTGGVERSETVKLALETVAAGNPPDYVLIHDAARPGLSASMIDALIQTLSETDAAAPALSMADAVKRSTLGGDYEDVDRKDLWRVQTPQAFQFPKILAAHRAYTGDAVDDLSVARAAELSIRLIPGDEALMKITYPEDFAVAERLLTPPFAAPRIGTGFDVHALEPGDSLWLCGVEVPHSQTLKGHSDADVGWHALTDAILGALAAGDIGDHFSPSDPRWAGAPSSTFLDFARQLVAECGFRIANVDVTLICEAPKIAPHRDAMRAATADLLQLSLDAVSIKATTTEKLGFTGRSEGIAAQASVSLVAAPSFPGQT
ncbi:MAG: bifunctional 2-C-methyl-D-erythritol 4-phosphate cytidylyltransferase/2-C-methyl-D-erythritol 2,4-cyclodiphosphate synthase [Pseudomonadota bacterium]